MEFKLGHSFSQTLEAQHPAHFRNRFRLPTHNGEEAIYFLGNSLGLQPKSTASYIEKVLSTWSNLGVEGFFKGEEPWLDYHQRLAALSAPVVGALPHEIVIMNSLTVNLHLMMTSFYQPVGNRKKIICEAKAFPSDQYMLETHLKQRGLNPEEIIIEIGAKKGAFAIDEEDILAAIEKHGNELALVFIGGVNYYTGQLFNMEAITKKARSAGAKVGFDLAHAAGNVSLQLHNWNVDFACWCTYKYLNSGPGAVGGVFVHEEHHNNAALNRFAGWWGYQKETQFKMEKGFLPEASAEGWSVSTPPVLLFAAHEAALQIVNEAGMENLSKRGSLLSNYLMFLMLQLKTDFPNGSIQIITPENGQKRGCQVSIMINKKGRAIFDSLTENGVFADWREPDVIRVAPVPLYNTFEEIWNFYSFLNEACKKHLS